MPPPPRLRLPWPRARPPSPNPEPLAIHSARPCDRARPAPTGDVAHTCSGVGFWSAVGALSARAETARVVGCWVDVTWAVCSRRTVVCGLVWPLGRARELSDQWVVFEAPHVSHCECKCAQPHVGGTDTNSDTLAVCSVRVGYYYTTRRPSLTLTGSRE